MAAPPLPGTHQRVDYYTPGKIRPPAPAMLRRIHAAYYGKLFDMQVWGVHGGVVREIDIDFALGGNPARYLYSPKNELWVEHGMAPADASATIFHEWVEYFMMRMRRLSYLAAHDMACRREIPLRRAKLKIKDYKEAVRVAEKWFTDHPETR